MTINQLVITECHWWILNTQLFCVFFKKGYLLMYSLLETDMAPALKEINPCILDIVGALPSQRNEVLCEWIYRIVIPTYQLELSIDLYLYLSDLPLFFTFYWVHIGQCASVAGSLFITLLARRGKLGFRVTATPGPFRWRWRRGKSEMQPRIHP